MARKTKIVTVTADGRDRGKQFLITEMPASQAEKWAFRAFFALGRAGIQVPDEMAGLGMAAIAVVGIRALAMLRFEDAEPLMDEMMNCVQAMPDPARPQIVRPLIEDDVEEPATRLFLRSEVLELHTGFSIADAVMSSMASMPSQDGSDDRPGI